MHKTGDKPPAEKQEAFKDFVRRIVAVPKSELEEEELRYQQERKKKRRK